MFTKEFLNNTPDYSREVVGEINDEASMTVPGEDISVTELMRRYASGTLPDVNFGSDSGEDEDEESVIPRGMSIFDAYDECSRHMEIIKNQMSEYEKEQVKAKERSEYERLKKLYEIDPNNPSQATE